MTSLLWKIFLILYVIFNRFDHSVTADESSVKLSTFMKICHRKDPLLNKCLKESIEMLKPYLKKGIPELFIPSFEPVVIREIIMNQGERSPINLQITYKNFHIWGISRFHINDFHIKLENNIIKFKMSFPNLIAKAWYTLNGKILMLPIIGNGIKEGNYSDVEGIVMIQGRTISKNNFTYFQINNLRVDLDVGHINIRFNNLFNGDKELGNAMNAIINENWRVIKKDITPIFEEIICDVVSDLFGKLYDTFPLEEILPE